MVGMPARKEPVRAASFSPARHPDRSIEGRESVLLIQQDMGPPLSY